MDNKFYRLLTEALNTSLPTLSELFCAQIFICYFCKDSFIAQLVSVTPTA